jgi:hypothetical protein
VGGGGLATANQTPEMKETSKDTLRNANKNEGVFGIKEFKNANKLYRKICNRP